MSNITLIKELWYEIASYIDEDDRQDAADSLVALLTDHDISPSDIREAFKNDMWVSDSLASYRGEELPEPEEEEYDWDDEESEEDEY